MNGHQYSNESNYEDEIFFDTNTDEGSSKIDTKNTSGKTLLVS